MLTEAKSKLRLLDIQVDNLEGQSIVAVWALDRITGKGEGGSHLYYRPVSDLDLSGFTT